MRGVTLPEDAARQEANRADNERRHARKQRRWLRSAAQAATRAWVEETPSESETSGDDEEEVDDDDEEGEIISSPRSLSPGNLPLSGDLFGRQAGILASAGQAKWPRADASGVFSPSLQSSLVMVCFVLPRMCACIVGARMTYLLGVL
jgi:hypothetical protein